MSITAVMTWVIPLGGITPVQRTASANCIPDDEDENAIEDELRSSLWFEEVFAPTAELIGVVSSDYGTMLLGLQLDCSDNFVPDHGDSMVGMWGTTPVHFQVASGFDLTRSIGKDLSQNGRGDEFLQFQEFHNNGGRCLLLNGLMLNLKSGDQAGLSLEIWTLPHETEPPTCIVYTKDFWTPEIPYGIQGPFGMFLDFFEYLDATSSNEGYQRWMERVRQEGTGSQLCSSCPGEDQPNPPNDFCPAKHIYIQDEFGNPTNTYDLTNCLGRAFSAFETCRDIAERNWGRCTRSATIGYGIIGGTACFSFTAPPAIAACLLATTGYSIYENYSCAASLKDEMKQCFLLLEQPWILAAEHACSIPPTTCP